MAIPAILQALGSGLGVAGRAGSAAIVGAGRGSLALAKQTPGFIAKASGAAKVPVLQRAASFAGKGIKDAALDGLKGTPRFLMKASGADKVPILEKMVGNLGKGFSNFIKEEKRRRQPVRGKGKAEGEEREQENKQAHEKAKEDSRNAQAEKQQSTLEAIAVDIKEIKENTAGGLGGEKTEGGSGGFLKNLGGILTGVFSSGMMLLGTRFSTLLKPFQALLAGVRSVMSKAASLISSAASKLVGFLGSIKDKAGALVSGAKNLVTRGATAAASIAGKAVQMGKNIIGKAGSLASGAAGAAGRLWNSAKGLIVSQGAKAGGKSLLKKIPVLGALAGAGFAANRAWNGDWAGAGLELGSGLASTIPGLGTAASIGIDAGLAARDYSRENEGTLEPTVAATEKPQDQPKSPEGTVATPTPKIEPVPSPEVTEASAVRPVSYQTAAQVEPTIVQNRMEDSIVGNLQKILARISQLTEAALNERVGIFTKPVDDALSLDSYLFQTAGLQPPERTGPRVEETRQIDEKRTWEAPSGAQIDAGTPVRSTSDLAPILDVIAKGEAEGYDSVWNGSRVQPNKPLSEMTFAEVKQWQKDTLNEQKSRGVPQDRRSSAAGRYQFISGTLKATQAQAGIPDDALFNAENQDKLAIALLDADRNRGLSAYQNGKASASDFQDYIASKWASVKNSHGIGVHDKPGFNNATTSGSEVIGAIESIPKVSATPTNRSALVQRSEKMDAPAPVVIPMPAAAPAPQAPVRATGPSSGSNNTPSVAIISRNPDAPIRRFAEGVMSGTI